MKLKFLFVFLLLLIAGVFVASIISIAVINFILTIIKGTDFSLDSAEIWGIMKMSIVGGSIGAIGIWLSSFLKKK
ncbi:hypothetical protein HBA43_18780 [Providencia rettgeri]|uniref:hypothetical protein n=1 Tax=Providencia TaxID=586 RepID=UPI0005B543E5|nr:MULTISPECIES: hypothetical protein [Providencia]EIU7556937.1 hypothetical protein [Providencia rettgeri]EJD6043367.1 hypothetical protein [Providencia rettgeri]EJD6369157.1 hypothetical protein [Providencia rettgeri]EJD6374205.1 hypothetical protein [Providencia rettgeri]EJD6672242.1 hypothetical protein [Providencia rettgeri]